MLMRSLHQALIGPWFPVGDLVSFHLLSKSPPLLTLLEPHSTDSPFSLMSLIFSLSNGLLPIEIIIISNQSLSGFPPLTPSAVFPPPSPTKPLPCLQAVGAYHSRLVLGAVNDSVITPLLLN